MPQIADTGYLVAFWSRADTHHRWARELAVNTPLQTCEAVLAETAHLLGRSTPLLQMLITGALEVNFNVSQQASELTN